MICLTVCLMSLGIILFACIAAANEKPQPKKETEMKITHIGFYAYCGQCNTEITDIKYEDIELIREKEEKQGYETITSQEYIITCPICGKELVARRHRKGE